MELQLRSVPHRQYSEGLAHTSSLALTYLCIEKGNEHRGLRTAGLCFRRSYRRSAPAPAFSEAKAAATDLPTEATSHGNGSLNKGGADGPSGGPADGDAPSAPPCPPSHEPTRKLERVASTVVPLLFGDRFDA